MPRKALTIGSDDELLNAIIAQSDQHTLTKWMRVNKQCNKTARRVLYRAPTIDMSRFVQSLLFSHTSRLVKNLSVPSLPQNCKLVKHLRIVSLPYPINHTSFAVGDRARAKFKAAIIRDSCRLMVQIDRGLRAVMAEAKPEANSAGTAGHEHEKEGLKRGGVFPHLQSIAVAVRTRDVLIKDPPRADSENKLRSGPCARTMLTGLNGAASSGSFTGIEQVLPARMCSDERDVTHQPQDFDVNAQNEAQAIRESIMEQKRYVIEALESLIQALEPEKVYVEEGAILPLK